MSARRDDHGHEVLPIDDAPRETRVLSMSRVRLERAGLVIDVDIQVEGTARGDEYGVWVVVRKTDRIVHLWMGGRDECDEDAIEVAGWEFGQLDPDGTGWGRESLGPNGERVDVES